MSWKARGEQTYLVAWPTLGIVKPGYTGNKRWRGWETRGAVVWGVWHHPSYDVAAGHERQMQDTLDQRYMRAFRLGERDLARSIIGWDGGGYLECFAVPTTDMHLVRVVLTSNAQAMPEHMLESCSSNARTDVRTYVRSTHSEREIFQLSNARENRPIHRDINTWGQPNRGTA